MPILNTLVLPRAISKIRKIRVKRNNEHRSTTR